MFQTFRKQRKELLWVCLCVCHVFYMCVHVCMNPSSNIMHCQNIVYATHRKKKTWPWYTTQFSLVRDCSSMAPLFDEHSLSTNIYFQLLIGIFGQYQPKQCIWDFNSNHGFILIVTISIWGICKSRLGKMLNGRYAIHCLFWRAHFHSDVYLGYSLMFFVVAINQF